MNLNLLFMKRTKKQITEDWKKKNRDKWTNQDPYDIVKEKKCSICKVIKEAQAFARSLDARSGLQSWCTQCRHAKHVKDPRHQMIANAKAHAKRKHIAFNITIEDLNIPDECPVLKIPMFLESPDKQNSPSIDKIKPERGYIKGNVRVISYRANTLKSNGTLEEMIKIVEDLRKIYENQTN